MELQKFQKLTTLSEKLLSQVRAEALVSLRFLDVALYKLKFRYDLNSTIYTDGEYLTASPYHIFNLYKSEDNLLLRTYLHIVLHCIFFHLFIGKKVDTRYWNLACDICVENIINELNLSTLIQEKNNPQIAEINILKQHIDTLTAEKLYKYFIDTEISDFEVVRLKNLFERDDHTNWYEGEKKTTESSSKQKNKNDDYKPQNKKELDDEEIERNEHEEKREEKYQDAKNDENINELLKDQEKEDEDIEEIGNEASNLEGDKNKSDTGETENVDADSTNKSDITDQSKNEEERLGGEEVDREVRTKNIDENLDGDEYRSIRDKLNEKLGNAKEKIEKEDTKEKSDDISSKNLKTTKTKKDDNVDGTYYDWKNISERTKEDLLMFENSFGDKTHTIKQYISFVNEEKYDYEKFLEKFAVMGESVELNDEEFDNIYYTFGLNFYKNVPLVEPLEYKEAKKIKDFVIAIDVSGSVKGEVVEKFLEKTYVILSKRDNYFTKVNIHIVLCDAEIKNIYKISSLNELRTIINDITLSGFGGTDFRPVFNYVEEMKKQKILQNLKGLIYFTDGLGEYPKNIPSFDTAFVFLKENYEKNAKNIKVPPWAIKIILDR